MGSMPDFDVAENYRSARADDDFDLPRYHIQRDPVRVTNAYNSPQVATPYSPPHPQQQSPLTAQRNLQGTRLSQIFPADTFGGSGPNLSRSTSLSGVSSGGRGVPRQQASDDVERAFNDLPPPNSSSTRLQQSFYPSSIAYNGEPARSDQAPYSLRRSATLVNPHSSPYQESTYALSTSSYADSYTTAVDSNTGPSSHLSSPASTAHQITNLNSSQPSYHPSINAAFQTPPSLPALLPTPSGARLSYDPSKDPLSAAAALLRPYQAQAQQARAGPSSTPTSPLQAFPSRHQSPNAHSPYLRLDEGSGNLSGPRPMSIDARPAPVNPPVPKAGFRRVRGPGDLRPRVNAQPQGRRADPNVPGAFLSPLKSLTANLAQTYNMCNPAFQYETAHNPRRVLTKPSKPVHNDGFDNEDFDYILYVNDSLGTEEGRNKYLILDVLGQGTFGQVVKCQNMKTHEIVAVKVVKNKPAYFNQSMMEVTILELLNNTWDVHDEHHILRLRDTFIHKSHLCLVFELLSSNLYELIKQNSFGGLSTQLVKVFTAQLLDALTVLNEAKLIHCDLKPENILLKSLQSPQIKVIDFGSACHERQTVYTYIQSRFYRSPEVLLGIAYTSAIDMWSLGCIAVELFLGLPLFPGTSEYNQLTRIVEMLGMPPSYMMEMGKQTNQFFNPVTDEYGRKRYRLKTIEQFSREHGTPEQPGKKYFTATTLPEIIRTAPQPKSASKPADFEKEAANRAAFIDFVQGLLNLNPIERWSPQQARQHPFITGEKFTRPYVPADGLGRSQQQQQQQQPTVSTTNPKQPYGGLVPAQPKGARAYSDAASYNQHLNQHQAYTAQAANQAANLHVARNPYLAQPAQESMPRQQVPPVAAQTYEQRNDYVPNVNVGDLRVAGQQQHRLQHQNSAGQLTSSPSAYQQQQQPPPPPPAPAQSYGVSNPAPPSSSYYPATRGRANTINQMDHAVPPQLARIAMGIDVSSIKRNTLTPVLNREEAIKEWERRQSGQRQPPPPAYPQLEFLQQQAELASSSWNTGHSATAPTRRFQPTSSLQHFQSPPSAVTVDSTVGKHMRESSTSSGLRDVNMGSLSRPTTGYDQPSGSSQVQQQHHHATLPPAPPQAYTSGASSARYVTNAQQSSPSSYQHSPNTVPYDTFDHRDGLATLYTPIQPNLVSPSSQQQQFSPNGTSSNGIPSAGSFYGGGVLPSSQQQQSMLGVSTNQRSQQQAVNAPPPSHQTDMWSR